jgi:hypothetical protein
MTAPSGAMADDSIVVLHFIRRKHAAKQFTRVVDKKTGQVKIKNRSYANENRFRVECVPLGGVTEFAATLERLIGEPFAFVIRGAPLPGIDLNNTPRWKRPHGGQPATFESAAHYWFLLDLDHIPVPPLSDVVNDPDAAIEHLIGLLPAEVRDARCWWEFTASQGLPKTDPNAPDTLSARLGFWSEVPATDSEFKRWATAANKAVGYKLVDPVLFDPIQPHYIAAPSFVGMADPLPRRHGIRLGLEETVSLIIPPPDAKHPDEISGEGYPPGRGVKAYLSMIGKLHFREPIKKAIASYIGAYGAAADCTELKKAIREAIDAADPGGRDEDILDRYKSDQHLDGIIAAIRIFQGDKPGRGAPPEPPPDEANDDSDTDDDDIDLEETDIGTKGGEARVISEREYRTRLGTAQIEEQKALDQLNKRFAVVSDAGKIFVIRWQRDHMLKRPVLRRMTFDHFTKLYLNRWIEVVGFSFGEKGARIYSVGYVNLPKWWLRHPDRRTFTGGFVFDPTGVKRDGFMNLWHGFGVKPAPGDWSLLRNHILLVICRGDPEQGDYFLNWLARLFQHPEEPGEVALVLRSDELGTGKSIVGRWVALALGRHGLHITNSGQLTGRFNAHLRDLVLLFCDEAFLVGDQKAIGVLKGLCTEQTIPIEGKGANIITVKNMLHILLASNNQSVIPAALTERRFAVFEVLDTHVDDHAYFAAIEQQMQNGGLAAMLHELLGRDISKFQVRKIPQTAGLRAQKTRSLPSLHRWWLTVLERGYLWKSRHGALWFRDWHGWYSTELLERSYGQWCDEHRISERDRKDRTQLGEFFAKLASASRPNGEHPIYEIESIDRREPKDLDEIAIAYKDRPPGYTVGSLDDARIKFTARFNIDTEWGAYPDDE